MERRKRCGKARRLEQPESVDDAFDTGSPSCRSAGSTTAAFDDDDDLALAPIAHDPSMSAKVCVAEQQR